MPHTRDNQRMRILLDFFPIALFVAAYKMHDIYIATAVLMAATVVQTGVMYVIDRRLQTIQKVTLGMILVFGTLTLVLQDDRFIKWKPTVLYGAMALVLGAALLIWKKNLLQMLLGSQLKLPEIAWHRSTLMWTAYFLFMAGINAYVAAYYSTEDWVNFKLWGYVFPIVFLVGQGLYLAKYLKDDEDNADSSGQSPDTANAGAKQAPASSKGDES
ncbi:septation protein A [Hydrogenophaga sp. 5NK40-0174]